MVYILTTDERLPDKFKRGRLIRVCTLFDGISRVDDDRYRGEKPPAS